MAQAEQREEAVFEAALQLPADQRAAYLDKACAGDADLRRRADVLLGAFERAGGFMKQPAAPERAVPASLPPTEKPGDRIGRYKLLEQIGEGGCGVVYVAEQEEPVRRRVALKVIKLGMDTKQVIARFDAERQALAIMDHPNIAKIHDAGITDAPLVTHHSSHVTSSGRPYFVMELVRGIKITDYCDQNHLAPRERLDLFIQVCRAIQHAHQKGVIHRDIKPSNILVTLHDGVPVPKVIDFGIAKATQGRLTDQTVYTAFEQFIGTPAYMSPEQAELSGLDIDTRSDIYSLGVLLYELLTGKTPFDAKELLVAGLDEMRRTIREVEPVKPSTRLTQEIVGDDVRRLTSKSETREPKSEEAIRASSRRLLQTKDLIHALRGDLDWIVMKCLEKDRVRRYETANGLAADLQRHLSNEPVIARPPSKLYEFQKSVRRHKFGFAAAGAVGLVLLAGVVVSSWQAVRATRAEREQSRQRELAQQAEADQVRLRQQAEGARAQAQANEQRAQTEAIRSAQVAQFLQDMLKGVGPSVALGRDTKLLREILDRTANRLATELTNQPAVEADLFETLGVVFRDLSDYGKAEAMLQKSLRLRKSLYGDEDRTVASAMHNLAEVWLLQGRSREAGRGFTNALAIRRKLCGNESIEVADSLHGLAQATRRSNVTRAKPLFLEALAIYRKSPRHKLEVARTLTGFAVALRNTPEDAEQLLLEAVAIQRELLGKHPDLANSLAQLGYVENSLPGKQDHAVSVLREALAMQKELLGDHRDTAGTITLLARIVKDADEAKRLDQEALEMRRRVLGEGHPDVKASLEFLSGPIQELPVSLRDELAKLELQAVQDEQLAKALKLAKGQRSGLRALSTLASALRAQGRLAEAIPFYWQLAEYGNIGALHQVAWNLATDADGSTRNCSNALAFAEKVVAATGRTNAHCLDTLAAAYAKAGQFTNAVSTEQTAIALLSTDEQQARVEFEQRLRLFQSGTPYRNDAPVAKSASELLDSRDFAAAEKLARQCLAIRERQIPDDWLTFNARSMLGGALLGQQKFAEAEPLLVSGYEGLKQRENTIPVGGKINLKKAVQRLAQLYEAIGRADQATEWKEKLAEFDKPAR